MVDEQTKSCQMFLKILHQFYVRYVQREDQVISNWVMLKVQRTKDLCVAHLKIRHLLLIESYLKEEMIIDLIDQ